MSNRTPLEDHIKSLFDQYEPEVPVHLWERINKEQRRKPVVFLFGMSKIAASLLLLGVGAFCLLGWYLWENNKIKPEPTIHTEEVEKTTSIEPAATAVIITTPTATKPSASIQTNATKNRTFTTDPNHQPTSILSEKLSTERKSTSTLNLKTADASKKTEEDNQVNQSKKLNLASRKKIKQQTSVPVEIMDELEYTDDSTKNIDQRELEAPADWLVVQQKLAMPMPDKITEKTKIALQIPCPASPNPAWNRAYFELYAGPDYVARQFSDTNANYANMRKQSTAFQYAYSAGFRYGRVFNNGLLLKTGLNYSLLTEKFDFIQGNIINIIYVTDASGDTIGSYQSTSARHKITYNKYRTIDVPLLVGYEMAKGRWNFNFSGGLIINLFSWNRGEVLDRSLQPVSINSRENPNPYQLKTNIGMGLQAGAGVYFALNQSLKLFAEPYFRYNLSSMTQSEIVLKQRYHTAGLRWGIRLDFNKK